jgi:NAD(P)-dependent dehydrogenase (short-subunit alcohol dehydrogenase family)
MPRLSRRQIIAGAAAAPVAAAAIAQAVDKPDLKGRSILITGAASGFGHVGALYYARAGATVIATMRNLPRPEAEALRKAARDEKLALHVVELDVLSDESVRRAVAEAERIAGGALDVVVNNAGIGVGGPVELQDEAAFRLMFETNVHGYQRVARAALPAMRARKAGLIFMVSSQLGRVLAPNFGVYCATKFAVEAMSEQLAYELAPHGVEVTIIQPGGYPTDIWAKGDRLTSALLARTEEPRKAAYAELVRGALRAGGGSTDPLDVPRAIAEIIALPAGQRPLRRPVHPGRKPQVPINEVSAQVQLAMLGSSPYGPWVRSVLT